MNILRSSSRSPKNQFDSQERLSGDYKSRFSFNKKSSLKKDKIDNQDPSTPLFHRYGSPINSSSGNKKQINHKMKMQNEKMKQQINIIDEE